MNSALFGFDPACLFKLLNVSMIFREAITDHLIVSICRIKGNKPFQSLNHLLSFRVPGLSSPATRLNKIAIFRIAFKDLPNFYVVNSVGLIDM